MYLNRSFSSVCLLLFVSISFYGQPAAKTLLWRITGRGLTKPSYLYGTMHLNDKRLFAFGDSVYHAIESSEGLAIEVNPDEMAAYTVNRLFDQLEKSKKITELFKGKDFSKYSAALEKKFKKPADQITTSDVVKEKNKWMSEYMEKGEMPTFVDAYLYSIARRQGKWLGGIEDMSDQAGLLEDMVDKSDIDYLLAGESAHSSAARDESMEKMIELYDNGDLESLDLLINDQSSPEHRDRILIRRNVKMARRIDSLTSLRTMFLAIGAAHLPGDSGVIYLLRKKGFTVEPVFSDKKINEKDYKFSEVHIPWFPVEDSQGLYTMLMPGNPATVKLYGIVEMKFLLDIFNMSAYCSMAVISTSDISNKDSMYNGLAKRMFQTDRQPVPKIINSDGIEGREYIQEKKAANMRVQMFLYNRTVYVSFMSAMKPGGLMSADAGKFFASLNINKDISLRRQATVFADPVMGISFTAPAPITYNKKLSNDTANGWKISAFTGTDISSGTYISVYSKEVKPGNYIMADSVIYAEFVTNIKKQYQNVQVKERLLQGYNLQSVTGRHALQPSLYINSVNLVKNGRNILVLAISDSAHLHAPGIDSIFSSLHFIDPPAVTWQLYTPGDSTFTVRVPAAIRSFFYHSDKKRQWYAYDTTSSVSYNIIPDTLGKYFSATNDSSFWKDIVTTNLKEDSLISQTWVRNGLIKGVDIFSKAPQGQNMYKRTRLLLDGRKLYKLFVSAENEFLRNDNTNSFFNSFRVNQPSSDSQFAFLSKTKLLLAYLATGDSATRYEAYSGLAEAGIAERDRAALQEALYKKYLAFYDTTVSTQINYEIADKLAKLGSRATIDYTGEHYGSFSERIDTLKNVSLSLLAELHTKESYDMLAKLVLQGAPREAFHYRFNNELRDSLALTAGIYPALRQLAADTIHADNIAGITNVLIDSGFLKMPDLAQAEKDFQHSAIAMQPALLRSASEGSRVYDLIKLLGKFNSPSSNKLLKTYLDVKSGWLREEVVIQLLKNGQLVPVTALNGLAADKSMRSSLYRDLKEIKKASLFPVHYLTQSYFAEASVYDRVSDYEEYEINSIRFLEKRMAAYNGRKYMFYLYNLSLTGNDTTASYLGIAGAYKINGASLEPVTDVSGAYLTGEFNTKSIGALLSTYLRRT